MSRRSCLLVALLATGIAQAPGCSQPRSSAGAIIAAYRRAIKDSLAARNTPLDLDIIEERRQRRLNAAERADLEHFGVPTVADAFNCSEARCVLSVPALTSVVIESTTTTEMVLHFTVRTNTPGRRDPMATQIYRFVLAKSDGGWTVRSVSLGAVS